MAIRSQLRHRVAAVSLCMIALQASAASVHDDYKSPLFAVPYAATLPKIDGVIDDAEWKNALSVEALQTTEGAVSSRQARVWMMWDDDHIYLALRSPLRPGEKVQQAVRAKDRDSVKTVFDDSYEIWLNADTRSPDGEIVFFQYLGNSAGAKYDVMFEPTVGNSRPGWTSGWTPANRITPDGKFWEMEVAIPRQSLYRNQPFADGEVLHGLVVRNFKRPWEQNNLGGSGSFSAPDSHCRFVLSKSAPALSLFDIGDPKTDTIGASIRAAASDTQTPLKWSFASDGGVNSEGTFRPGEPAGPGPAVDKVGNGYFRIRVTSADGSTPYLDWSSRRAFGDKSATTQPIHDTDDRAELTLTFNPVHDFVTVEGDLINYAARGTIRRFVATVVDAGGKSLVSKDLALDELAYVHGMLKLPDCPAGKYVTRLVGYDAGGREVLAKQTPFEKKDLKAEYPWWNTTVGRIDRVIEPWTAVVQDGPATDVWGRRVVAGAAGLPTQITSQQTDLLAGATTLVADTDAGPVFAKTGTPSVVAKDYVATQTCDGNLGEDITVSSETSTAFDGLLKVRLTLTPHKATKVKALKVVIPIKSELASYCHACGEGVRYGFSYGFLPTNRTGRLWDSKQVDGQPMLVGSFVPYVWLGNDKIGLCFMADGDEGWSPNNDTPAIEIRRDAADRTDLVLNLIGTAETLDKPRTITFALQATPVKPMRLGWRMDTWSTADSFKDFCRVEPVGGHLIWNALPFTLDPAGSKAMVDERHHMDDEYNFGFKSPKYHANAVPYFENNGIDKKLAPAADYFADQWHARVSDSSWFDKSAADFVVWNLDQWTKQTGMDGWYVDNVRPVACDNIDAGRGYRLPDGRVQPTYDMFGTREYFLRVRAMFQDNGKSGKFVLHMTNHMIMPWIGAADLALDGEDHVTLPDMGKDFIDFWSPTRLRLDDQGPQGTPVTFLQEFQGNWTAPDLMRVMRSYTAMTILHDVLPGANPNGNNKEVWRGRERFGIADSGVTFLPYWRKDNGVTIAGENLYASTWRKPQSLLIATVNAGPEKVSAAVHVDLAKFNLPADAKAMDADTGAPLEMTDGVVTVPIDRHDYRQILITAAPPAEPGAAQ